MVDFGAHTCRGAKRNLRRPEERERETVCVRRTENEGFWVYVSQIE